MNCTAQKIEEGIWQLNEPNEGGPYVDAYLICGSKRALLVDCLQNAENLYEEVRKITNLPVDVVITHGHGDHAGGSIKAFSEAGCKVYISKVDIKGLLKYFPVPYKEEVFRELEPRTIFDLGGFTFTVLPVAGHTAGSVVLLEKEHQILFSGDSIGSGHFWMQIPGCLPLSQYLPQIQGLYEETKELSQLKIYPGHRAQAPAQLGGQYIQDVLTITKGILDKTMVGEDDALTIFDSKLPFKYITYGQVEKFCYNPNTL